MSRKICLFWWCARGLRAWPALYQHDWPDRPAWQRIIADLEGLAQRAESAATVGDIRRVVGFVSAAAEKQFARNFRANADALAAVARELAGRLPKQLLQHECVTVFGM